MISKSFVFVDGQEFELAVRVTDSDPWGKTVNTANVTLILRDQCKEIQVFYDEAVQICSEASLVVNGEALPCPSMNCLQSLYNWQNALNNLEAWALRKECSFDPQNMKALKERSSMCTGE